VFVNTVTVHGKRMYLHLPIMYVAMSMSPVLKNELSSAQVRAQSNLSWVVQLLKHFFISLKLRSDFASSRTEYYFVFRPLRPVLKKT
jgi:hypothetical protein